MRLLALILAALVLAGCDTTPGPAAPEQGPAPAPEAEPMPAPYEGPVDVNGNPIGPRSIVALGEACGGMMGLACQGADDGATFCAYEPEAICGAADALGRCTITPIACPRHYRPVCGCDGATYANACLARANRTSVAAFGPCERR